MFHTISTIKPICDKLHSQDRKIVLATGFFDLLHQEHQIFLTKAASHGDVLIVAVESDARAKALKGTGRPIQSQIYRAQHILDLGLADYVITLADDFDNLTAYASLMAAVRPAIYAVSSHTLHQKNKIFLSEKYGGKLVVVHDHNPKFSTTQIINST